MKPPTSQVAAELVGSVIRHEAVVALPSDAQKLLHFVQPLMNDAPGEGPPADQARPDPIDDETAMELGPVARLIHAFRAPTTDDQCRILNSAHRQATQGGALRKSPYSLVPIVFACLPLARRIHLRVQAGESVTVGVGKMLGFVSSIITALTPLAPSLALRLNLTAALVADSVGAETDAYDFVTAAFTCYEVRAPPFCVCLPTPFCVCLPPFCVRLLAPPHHMLLTLI